jgi:hypothetical protein
MSMRFTCESVTGFRCRPDVPIGAFARIERTAGSLTHGLRR